MPLACSASMRPCLALTTVLLAVGLTSVTARACPAPLTGCSDQVPPPSSPPEHRGFEARGGGGLGSAPAPKPGSAPGRDAPGASATPAGAPGVAPSPGAGFVVDPQAWDLWWSFNRHPYLSLRSKLNSGWTQTGSSDFFLGQGSREQVFDRLRPTREVVGQKVVPAILQALECETNNEVVAALLMALAKTGDEDGSQHFESVIARYLADGSQRVAEAAVMALGVLGSDSSVSILTALMRDQAYGRFLVGRKSEVPYRTRALATYGLGLIGHRSQSEHLRRVIVALLADVLGSPSFATRDIKVAAMTAFGLTALPVIAEDAPSQSALEALASEWQLRPSSLVPATSRESQLVWLAEYLDQARVRQNRGVREDLVRAHVPTAMARLLEGLRGQERKALQALVVAALQPVLARRSRYERSIEQSTALALGLIVGCPDDSLDWAEDLVRIAEEGDSQARRFAVISIGRLVGQAGDTAQCADGAARLRQQLIEWMEHGPSRLRPWAALALGVAGRAQMDRDQAPNTDAGAALRECAEDCKSPADAGAYLIALGLRRDPDARQILLDKLAYFRTDNARGYATVALGLVGDRRSLEALQEVIRQASKRPALLNRAAIGLGLLGDRAAVPQLIRMLREARSFATQAALASALGAIGDVRAIDPLVEMLADQNLTASARSYAALALGIVCDKETLPWNSKVATNVNYRASTTTLTSSDATGILDIL